MLMLTDLGSFLFHSNFVKSIYFALFFNFLSGFDDASALDSALEEICSMGHLMKYQKIWICSEVCFCFLITAYSCIAVVLVVSSKKTPMVGCLLFKYAIM